MMEDRKHFEFERLLIETKAALPENWIVHTWDTVNYGTPAEALKFTGSVCAVKYTKGKKKGLVNFAKRDKSTEMEFTFTRSELASFKEDWEQKTGLCSYCHGNGTYARGWSATNGTEYADCKKCGATGRVN